MPRFPVRTQLFVMPLACAVVGVLLAVTFVNPAARVRDPRLATQYNAPTLACLASGHGYNHIWLGSLGGGIKDFDPTYRLFRPDLNRQSTQQKLLSDYILDVNFSPRPLQLAAIVAAESMDAPGGVQLATVGQPPVFWDKPCIDLSRFPGLTDASASCVIATGDKQRLVIGTHGHGLGIYSIRDHAWTARLTVKDGLPSDNILDLASVSAPQSDLVVWAATDKGLCAGPCSVRGQIKVRWVYSARTGLAGDSVRRIVIHGPYCWYLTSGGGLGRIGITTQGEPAGDFSHELLVTERRLPGLEDGSLRLAKGSPAGPTTWFIAEVGRKNYIGRYREKPHDITGVVLPEQFDLSTLSCLAADAETGRAAILGTDNGAWFYHEPPQVADVVDRTNFAPLGQPRTEQRVYGDLAGFYVGPEATPVIEAAIAADVAILKTKNSREPAILQKATVNSKLPWQWSAMVGSGRFPDLRAASDVTCVAGALRKAYFGTNGKGIGVWDRNAMELRRELHSSSSNVATRLRNNTSLDLAWQGDLLIQVTGDKAVDVFNGQERLELVPSTEAPFGPTDLLAATAKDSRFVAAGAGKLGLYDMRSFSWSELPDIANVAQLEITGERLWALDKQGTLSGTLLQGGQWEHVADNVRQIVPARDLLYALLQDGNNPAELWAYSAKDGAAAFKLAPHRLDTARTNWRLAAAWGDKLVLAGDDAALHLYQLATRQWERLPFPGEINTPLTRLVPAANRLWLLDNAGTLHRFETGDNSFSTSVETRVERIAGAGTTLLALRQRGQGDRLVMFSGGQVQRRVLVGKPFGGDLTRLADAVECNGQLVVAEAERVGFYDWNKHNWETVLCPAGAVTALYAAGDTLWALASTASGATLLSWTEGKFKPVAAGESKLSVKKLTADSTGLFALDTDGKLWRIAAARPAEARELLTASKLSGGLPGSAEQMALQRDDFVVARDQTLYRYGPSTGLARWTAQPVQHTIHRLVNDPAELRLVAEGDSGAWVYSLDSDGKFIEQELTPLPGANPEPVTVTGIAAGKNESVCAFQVRGESGSRVRTLIAGGRDVRDLVGAPLPPSGTTRTVVEAPDGERLLRLDTAGTVAVYSLVQRSWRMDSINTPLDALWRVGDEVLGYNRQKRSLFLRTTESWRADQDHAGNLEKVASFPDGLVLTLGNGAVQWYQSGGRTILCRPAHDANAIPSNFDTVDEAAEADDLLALLSANGRLAVFDWPKQTWQHFATDPGPVRALLRHAGGLYVVIDVQGRRQLAGPLRRAEDGTIVAPAINSPRPVRKAVVTQFGLFCLAEDGVVYRLTDGTLKKWWGSSVDGEQANGKPRLLAADTTGNKAYLLVQRTREAAAKLMTLDLTTLESHSQDTGLRNLMVAEGSLWGVTTTGVWRLTSSGWESVGEPPPAVVERLKIPSLLTNQPPLIVTNAEAGAWLDATSASRNLDVFVTVGDRTQRLVAAANRTALAHEIINDIDSNGESLLAISAGGLVELRTDGDRDNPAPRPVLTEAPDDTHARQLSAPKRPLDNWELGASTAAGTTLRRRFKNGQWRAVRLQAGGFDFEQVNATEIANGQLRLSTPAGTLIFNQDSRGLEPDDLVAATQRQQVVPSAAPGPFLDSNRWTWERPKAGTNLERVRWKTPEGALLTGYFDPSVGRLDWDVCLALGQAAGEVWLLTPAGLLRVSGDHIDNASFQPMEKPATQLRFLNVSSDLPGALVTDTQEPVLLYDGAWKQPEAGRRSSSEFRVAGKVWKLRRDGQVLRSRPQDPERFDVVRVLPSGVWDFETITDLAAGENSCLLATEAGLGAANGTEGGLAGLWSDLGKPEALDTVQGKPLARLRDGRLLEFSRGGWYASEYRGSLPEKPVVRESKRWRVTREPGSLTLACKRSETTAFAPVKVLETGFAFDHIHDAHLCDAQSPIISTAEGLLEQHGNNGDLQPVEGLADGGTESVEFFTTQARSEGPTLYARTQSGRFLKYQNRWQNIADEAGRQAQQQAQTQLAVSGFWQVTAEPGQAAQLRLHLTDDPREVFKPVEFNPQAGLFGFDEMRTLAAPDPQDRLIVGTRSGVQRTKTDGTLQRLWCQRDNAGQSLDGIGPVPVEQMVRDEAGVVQLLADGQSYQLDPGRDAVIPSVRQKLTDALALRAADRNGWRVEFHAEAAAPWRLWWKDQPVFLVRGDGGKARFAHNVVSAVAGAGAKLVFATQGGLALLDSARPEDRGSLRLIAKPFIMGESLPLAFDWLGADPDRDVVFAQLRAERGQPWEINMRDPEHPTRLPAAPQKLAVADAYHDDALVWHHPQSGQVTIQFMPGKAVPEGLEPAIAEGTFQFLNLDILNADNPPATLLHTPGATFWISRGGVVQFDSINNEFLKLHAEIDDRSRSLTQVRSLLWGVLQSKAFARDGRDIFEFEANQGKWVHVTNSMAHPFLDRSLVNNSRMLEWRQSHDLLRITLKAHDCEKLPFFADGKPRLDEINDFAFAPSGQRDGMLLATRAGVADYEADDFGYVRLHGAAFATDCRNVQSVTEIATVQPPGADWRTCARLEGGRTFEAINGQWQPRDHVEDVFELSYRCVLHEGLWSWSRYPAGLSCTLFNVNGSPYRLGSAVNRVLPPIFSRGKLAIDDARAAVLTAQELLVATAAGLVHFALTPDTQQVQLAGIDVWAKTGSNAVAGTLADLQGVLAHDDMQVWNNHGVFTNASADLREWILTTATPASLRNVRWVRDGRDAWLVEALPGDSKQLSIRQARGILGSRWFVPVQDTVLCGAGVSDDGLWVLAGNDLFLVDRAKISRNWRRSFGQLLSPFRGKDTP